MRRLLTPAATLTVAIAGLFLLSCGPAEPQGSRHLLVVCIDTLRADHVGTYGYSRPTTPWIDALAEHGALFEEAYAHSSWTVPSTASLLTSLLPYEHGAVADGEVKNMGIAEPPLELRHEVRSLPQILRQAGFRTAMFSANAHLKGRLQRGFEVAEARPQGATSLTTQALAWIGEEPDRPFFAYLQYMDVHEPVYPPEPFFSFFEAGDGERGPEHAGWAFQRLTDPALPAFRRFRDHKVALYDGALRYVDSEIGRLLSTLREMGVVEDTLVVVTSDHGEEFWDHAELGRRLGGDPRGIWGVGHGHNLFEEQLRVPLVFWGRQVLSPRRFDCEVGQLDVAPTVLDFLGVESPPEMRGRSLRRLLTGEAPAGECPGRPIFAESLSYGWDARAVIHRRRKLIERDDGVSLAYDLASDPGEELDLAAGEPPWRAALSALLAPRREAAAEPGERTPRRLDDETIEQLRSLGYVQ